MCGVSLDGWEEGDNPILEHHTHSYACAWALNAYVKLKFDSDEPILEDPMAEVYRSARAATFEGKWPHENKRGWKCKIAKVRLHSLRATPSANNE
jgi:hypothetical protein